MAWEDPLKTSLLDLLYELRERPAPITVGGGFGLYLKRLSVINSGARTLFSQLPLPRTTNDLDLFVRAEVLCDLPIMKAVAAALQRLDYKPIESAKYMQCRKDIEVFGQKKEIKIDLLVGPLGEYREKLHLKPPRARPPGAIKLHSHMVEEALDLDNAQRALSLHGPLSNGETYEAQVWVPQAFPYLMMKLFAFRDRRDDTDKDLGRHHALDLYSIVALQDELEYGQSKELGKLYAKEEHVVTARKIVREDFSTDTGLGMLRLREHSLFRDDFALSDFREVLGEIFAE